MCPQTFFIQLLVSVLDNSVTISIDYVETKAKIKNRKQTQPKLKLNKASRVAMSDWLLHVVLLDTDASRTV